MNAWRWLIRTVGAFCDWGARKTGLYMIDVVLYRRRLRRADHLAAYAERAWRP